MLASSCVNQGRSHEEAAFGRDLVVRRVCVVGYGSSGSGHGRPEQVGCKGEGGDVACMEGEGVRLGLGLGLAWAGRFGWTGWFDWTGSIEHVGPLGSLGLNGAGETADAFIPTGDHEALDKLTHPGLKVPTHTSLRWSTQLSRLGGRHSHPVVTAPTIALDFSDTTQQSASHNVAPNQILPGSNHATGHFLEAEICYNTANILAQFLIIITLNLLPEANPNPTLLRRLRLLKTELKPQELLTQKLTLAEERTHRLFSKASKSSSFAFPLPAKFNRLKRVANERAKQGEFSATKISKNKGWMRWKSREEMSR
ncbi:hypothetical protein F511_22959 [Dorcoceras hygrometricum]|uniref:Uncharacterized protein n=1 Tax=Dorcoceras hygrometricum TaxID=472368 RepID=A0A2Z7B618_9LAMI|nr:hypothetical protein F511_22959 [Dorcoceras hygrometricum]